MKEKRTGMNKIKSFLKKRIIGFKNFLTINDEPLIVGKVYQLRMAEEDPFQRKGIYIIDSKKGFVQYKNVWKNGEFGVGCVHSDKNRIMNMLYALSELEYDFEGKKWK